MCVHEADLLPLVCVQCCPSGSFSAGPSPPRAPARPPERWGLAGGLPEGRCWPIGSPNTDTCDTEKTKKDKKECEKTDAPTLLPQSMCVCLWHL